MLQLSDVCVVTRLATSIHVNKPMTQKIMQTIQKTSRFTVWGAIAAGMVIGAIITAAIPVSAQRDHDSIAVDELAAFTEVMQRIKRNYVEDVDDKTLVNNAIRGMVSGLDPHSSYFSAEELEDFTVSTTGKFGGLGIEVQMQDGFVKVVAPIDDTPAQRAGVQAGDLIIRLDDKPVKGMTLQDAVSIMRGDPGTDIVLTVVRDGVMAPFEVEITRDIIRVKSVKSRMLESNLGYVRVSQFQERTGDQLRDAIEDLVAENQAPLQGIVLDLRNNPGGVLSQSIAVADAFIDSGLIVYTQGRNGANRNDFGARGGDVLNGAPIVVLVNGGSASASEIVAGALQDHKRALIMGTPTFGKGSVQTLEPLNNGSALKITTALYYTPNGTSIQAQGIVPDIAVEPLQIAERDGSNFSPTREADLTGRLDNGNDDDDESSPSALEDDSPKTEDSSELAKDDYQLFEALNLLKGMVIFQTARTN